jgi:MoaA/NifB/PqqE/SkfB family radical SAM enzyme
MYYQADSFHEVNIELTNQCNFDCWFCPRSAMTRPQGRMSYENFARLVDALLKADVINEVALAGIGEPTLHPDLLRMIRLLKEKTDYKVVLTTNASRFGDREFCEQLLATGIDMITVSFRITAPELDRQSLPATLNYQDYFAGILDFVELQQKESPTTELELACLKETIYSKYVLGIDTQSYLNRQQLSQFVQAIGERLGIPLPSYADYTGSFQARLSNVDRVPIGKGLSLRFDGLSSWTTAYQKYGEKGCPFPANRGSCLGMSKHFGVYWNGDVSTCCADFNVQNRLGNLFAEDLVEILAKPASVAYADALQQKRMPTRTCRICRGGMTRREKWANVLGTWLYQ